MGQSVAKELKTGYQLDPASVGVTLGAPGMPTREGWNWVTPEMWKLRWSVADKIMVLEPDYYKDRDWYLDTQVITIRQILACPVQEGKK